ncbi:MAG: DUF4142 domain-containing protein [Acetobacter syzygii]|uniref:DUF4142 domain-containing protein n=1 Tax=Acetobacter syzygii TaxID=146476 RepID=UPI0039E8CF8B
MSFLFRHKACVLSPLLVLLLGVSGCAYVTPGQPPAPPLPVLAKPAPFTAADAAFVQKLNAFDLVQIALANTAKTHAARNDLALLGASMTKDLTDAQTKLAKLASTHSLTLPTKPTAAEQKQIDRLGQAHGAGFDRRYILLFTTAHGRIKPALASQIALSKNPDLVAIARNVQTRLADYQAVMK